MEINPGASLNGLVDQTQSHINSNMNTNLHNYREGENKVGQEEFSNIFGNLIQNIKENSTPDEMNEVLSGEKNIPTNKNLKKSLDLISILDDHENSETNNDLIDIGLNGDKKDEKENLNVLSMMTNINNNVDQNKILAKHSEDKNILKFRPNNITANSEESNIIDFKRMKNESNVLNLLKNDESNSTIQKDNLVSLADLKSESDQKKIDIKEIINKNANQGDSTDSKLLLANINSKMVKNNESEFLKLAKEKKEMAQLNHEAKKISEMFDLKNNKLSMEKVTFEDLIPNKNKETETKYAKESSIDNTHSLLNQDKLKAGLTDVGQSKDKIINHSGDISNEQTIKNIQEYITKNIKFDGKKLDVAIHDKYLGNIKLGITGNPNSEVELQIETASKRGFEFFSNNKNELLTALSNNGIRIVDYKLERNESSSFSHDSGNEKFSFNHRQSREESQREESRQERFRQYYQYKEDMA